MGERAIVLRKGNSRPEKTGCRTITLFPKMLFHGWRDRGYDNVVSRQCQITCELVSGPKRGLISKWPPFPVDFAIRKTEQKVKLGVRGLSISLHFYTAGLIFFLNLVGDNFLLA